MYFVINGRRLDVLVHPRPIVRDGETFRAWLDDAAGRILINVEVPRDERRVLLFHELRHAWTNQMGRPADDAEADATSVAAFTDELLSQYEEQGGDDVLIALNPMAGAVPVASASRYLRDRQSCGKCAADVMCGSIINDAPVYNDELACWVIRRGMICAVCGANTVWFEQSTEQGVPLGIIMPQPPPAVLQGEDARAWWIAHEDRLLMLQG